jgi:tRNA pseudouridine38-40 synthase
MRKIALVVEYEGTRYHGFQIQDNVSTVQGELERALNRLTGERIRIASASRTDVGVHARGQVVTFGTGSGLPLPAFVRALNHYLPPDIAVSRALVVRPDFDARRDALSREYCYYLLNTSTPSPLLRRSAYFVPVPLDVAAMNQAGKALIGTHDFAPFSGSIDGGRSTVRTMYRAEAVREGHVVTFHMVANSFLPHQVRNTTGALLKVGLGKSDVESFRQIASSKLPGVAGPALPSRGLCLIKVNYPDDGAFDENL